VSWTFCSDLNKTPINTSTNWEIWGHNIVNDEVRIMTIDFVPCANVQEQIVVLKTGCKPMEQSMALSAMKTTNKILKFDFE